MIVANSQLIPEFQYWFNHFIVNSVVNRYEIPIPVEVDPAFIPKGTTMITHIFIKMKIGNNAGQH